jgi:hypothetical protein
MFTQPLQPSPTFHGCADVIVSAIFAPPPPRHRRLSTRAPMSSPPRFRAAATIDA